MKKKITKSYLIYVLILVIALLLQGLQIFDTFENEVEDNTYQTGTSINPYIYVIGIDEETLSRYGSFDTWGREKMADLINLLSADPDYAPSVIAIDVGYFGNKDEDIDNKLVTAVKNAGNVILTETATFGASTDGGNEVIVYEEPFEELKEASLGTGHANINLDSDGVARHASGNITYKGEEINSFDISIYRAYLESKGESFNSDSLGYFGTDSSGFYIVYSGKARSYYGSVGAGCSFYKVLEGEYPTKAFKDSIVLIGAYASGMQDNYYTSIDDGSKMNGVEIHANILNQLITGNYKKELTGLNALIPTLVIGLIAILVILLLDLKFAIPINILLGVGYFFLCRLSYTKFNLILPVIYTLSLIFLIILSFIVVRYFIVHREKKRMIDNYGKYLSPEVAKTIADIGEDKLALGGTKKDISVLFVDIRGFTTLSESLPPERVVEMLNSYLKITTTAIFNNKGTVDKFIGDATMGVFNAPLDLDDYTYRSVCAGLDMAEMSKNIDDTLPSDLKGRVGFGVGINCGDAVVGNIGTNFRMEYTAIGDTVNTASRLEGQAKAGWVVISEAVYDRVKDRINCEDLGSVSLKGKAEPVKIYRALNIK